MRSPDLSFLKYNNKVTLMGGRGLTGWFDVPSLDGTAGEDAVGFAESTEVVMRLVESEVQRGVPPKQYFS